MSIVYRLDGALLPFQTVRLQGNDSTANGFPSFATMGEPGIAAVRIEDPSGTLDINGWHTFTVEETACSKPRIFTGWVLGRRITRGPYRTGAGRIWECEIIDQNAALGFEVFRSSAASIRPAETDVARITAMIASHAMGGTPVHNNGRLSTSNPLALAAANFVTQTPAEMLSSTAGQCAKNGYLYWDDSADQISIHYDAVGAGPSATISVSNVLNDVTSDTGGTCYAPFRDAELEQDPTPLYTGVLLHWTGGYTYDRNQTVINDLSPSEFSPTNFLRDLSIDSDRIGKASTAASQVQKQLQIHSVEHEELTFTVQVTAAHVNLAQAGDVMSVRFAHIPGYETATNVAITKRFVEPTDGMDALYNITYTVTNNGVPRGAGGGGVGGLPKTDCTPQLVQESEAIAVADDFEPGTLLTTTATPTAGNLQVIWLVTRNTDTRLTPDGFTGVGSYPKTWQDDPAGTGTKAIGCRFFYRWVVSGDSTNITFTRTAGHDFIYAHISEWSGVDNFQGLYTWTDTQTNSDSPRVFGSATFTPTADLPALAISGLMPSNNVNDNWNARADFPALDLAGSGFGNGTSAAAKSWLGYMAGPKSLGLPMVIHATDPDPSSLCRGFATLTLVFNGTCPDSPPVPGQPVNTEPPASVGGGQVTFTTENPYAEGSLKVYVDGIRQPVVESNPATGEYRLYFDPRPSEYVFVDYQARTGGE